MGIQRWQKLERAWGAGEIIDPHEPPMRALTLCHSQLVSRNMEGRPVPTGRGFHFDQAGCAVRFKAGNIIAGTVAVFVGNPAHPLCQIMGPDLS
jgi:hypothetical protein